VTNSNHKKYFYHLQYPTGESRRIYGRSAWRERFGSAEWPEKSAGLSTGRMIPPLGEPRLDLTIILPSRNIGDFVWTWYSDCIVTDRVLSLFRREGFTGFETRPVKIQKIRGLEKKRKEDAVVPQLWELLIVGKGGEAAPESGIYRLRPRKDGTWEYSSFRNGIIVDDAGWDGSDFFTINGYHRHILVSERVKEFIIANQFTNCAIIPADKLEWKSGIRPEEFEEEQRAMAARDLESLLADIEKPDVSLDAIQALGNKGDHRAVDPLIQKFSDPWPLIWHPAASAVAAIAKHKDTPEQIREEIFSRLCDLLRHENYLVRRSAITALGYIGGDRAAEEVVKLFTDRDYRVRNSAVFVVGYLKYKPALEAVKRLTRDRNKTVREEARRTVDDLLSEFP
jgi:hypothetical protein